VIKNEHDNKNSSNNPNSYNRSCNRRVRLLWKPGTEPATYSNANTHSNANFICLSFTLPICFPVTVANNLSDAHAYDCSNANTNTFACYTDSLVNIKPL
jgi:hypothetical protein